MTEASHRKIRELLRAMLPPQPDRSEYDIVRMKVRLPDGQQIDRLFQSVNTVEVGDILFGGEHTEEFRLLTSVPQALLMWVGGNDCILNPTNFVLKDCSRRPPAKVEISDSSEEIGDFFGGKSQVLLLAENEVYFFILIGMQTRLALCIGFR